MSTERDFEIGSRQFKLNKIDVFQQFHIVRRIAPILTDLLPSIKDFQKLMAPEKELTEAENLDAFASIATPLVTGLAKLSDEDANRVFLGLLKSVEVKQTAGNWARIANDSMIMMQDLELPILIQAAGRAFMFNLKGFFAALPQHT